MKHGFKRLRTFLTCLFSSLLVVPGIVTLCTDINGSVNEYLELHAEEPITECKATLIGNNSKFADVVDADLYNMVKATLQVTGTAGSTVIVKVATRSVSAIETIDFTGIDQTFTFTFDEAGVKSETVYVKTLVTNKTRALHRLNDYDGNYTYGRSFLLEITDAFNQDHLGVTVERAYLRCFPTTSYSAYFVNTTYKNKNIAYYRNYEHNEVNSGLSQVFSLNKDQMWKSWEKTGRNYFATATPDGDKWKEKFIDPGLAEVYGTWEMDEIRDVTFESDDDVKFCFGNERFIQIFTQPNESDMGRGMLHYFDVNPIGPNYRYLNMKAMRYVIRGTNPYAKDNLLANVDFHCGSNDYIDFYYKQSFTSNPKWTKLGSWYKIQPYEGKYNIGLAIKNTSKKRRDFREVLLHMDLKDFKLPTIKESYAAYDYASRKIRLYLRFSETVYAQYKKDVTVRFNGKYDDYTAKFVGESNYSDTLVYELTDAPLNNITSIAYFLPDNDIGDCALNYDSGGNPINNKIDKPTSERKISKIIEGSINLTEPDLATKPDKSGTSKNVYNITVSANNFDSISFSEGTVYYVFDKNPTIENPNAIASYADGSIYELTEDDNGSFQVTLANKEAGDYYLHALVITKKSIVWKTFGPYRLDGRSPEITQLTPSPNDLKQKTYQLKCKDKDLGTYHKNVTLQVKYTENNTEKTATLPIIDDGGTATNRASITTEGEYTIYKYNSDIAEGAEKPDVFIQGLMGTNKRFVANVSFLYEDSAGNRATSNSIKVTYDTRETFDLNIDAPGDYHKITSGEQYIDIGEDVYNIHNASSSGGLTFSPIAVIPESGGLFYLIVNGQRIDASTPGSTSITLTGATAGHYEVTGYITGGDGETVNAVSKTVTYYLTDDFKDSTPNKTNVNGDLVLTNKVFQISNARYYYFNSINNTIGSHLYGATYDELTKKYINGSSNPAFSNSSEAKNYLRYMEYQDLYLIELNETMAQMINTGSGSTQYMKADGETKTAQAGQLWIRYKRSSWRDTSDSSGWALYYYGTGSISDGINYNDLSTNLVGAMNSVVNTISSGGSFIYLVDDEHINQFNGAPYLASSQIHAHEERVSATKCGLAYVTDLIYDGDENIYKNKVTVTEASETKEYPLANNMPLTVDEYTKLYYKVGNEWILVEAEDGTTLANALPKTQTPDHYLLREYTSQGVGEFEFYLDNGMPILYVHKDGETEPMALDNSASTITCRTMSFETITKSGSSTQDLLPDDLSYVAIYTYPYKALITVLYEDQVKGYTLSDGNYYLQVGDRSGNMLTFVVLTSSTTLDVDVTENTEKTAVYVRVTSRSEAEIYSYQVYVNEVLIDTVFAQTKLYRDSGVYRVVVRDIYGNTVTKIMEHDSPLPNMTWYYLNDNGGYSAYDPNNIVRMRVVDSVEDARVTNVYGSTLVSVIIKSSYETGEVAFEVTDVEPGEYTYNEATGLLTFTTLKSWSLRVWYDTNPDVDRIFVFKLDNTSPSVDATFVGTRYDQNQDIEEVDISGYEYEDIVSLDELGYSASGSFNLPINNGEIIFGSNITISLTDPTGIKTVTVTRDGQPVEVPVPNGQIEYSVSLSGYGHFIVVATDSLSNASRFEFTNVRESNITDGYVDSDEVKENSDHYGHQGLLVETLYEGETKILLTIPSSEGTHKYTYVFNYKDGIANYGYYFVNKEIVDDEVHYFADFKVMKTVYDANGDYKTNTWYDAIRGVYFIVSVMVDDSGNISYKIECTSSEITVETLTTTAGDYILNRYKAILSKANSDLDLYTDGEKVSKKTGQEYIYIAGDLTLAPLADVDAKITKIEVAYNKIPEMEKYKVVYYDGHYLEDFLGTEDGFYEVRVTNIYNNVITYKISKIDNFNSLVKIHVMDGSDVLYSKYREGEAICSNYSIELIIYSDSVLFNVNGTITPGYYSEGATILELKREGNYEVRVIGDNGVYEDFLFEIKNDDKFLYQEDWITGYNEEALLRDSYYTNTLCDINVDDEAGVVYIDMDYNDTLIRLYDNITDNRMTDREFLKGAIGRYGDGYYIVGFRNKYGDLVKHTVYYSATPALTLSRIVTSDPNVYEPYSLEKALEEGFYSNYVLKFETTSTDYIFTINDEGFSLETPKTLEFSNISGIGSFSYKVTYIDEYGNNIEFDAILNREELEIDSSLMKITTLSGEPYTKDDIKVTFKDGLTATVSVDGGVTREYKSGQTFYKDGKYQFIVTDIAGNQETYTINHKSVNHYRVYNTSNDQDVIQGGVLNHATVAFSPSDDSKIKYVFRNGELQEEHSSNNFTTTGHWEIIIEDSIGNQSYEEFYLINNSLSEFNYTTPYEYEITEVWRVNPDGSRELLNFRGETIKLKEKGDYVIVVSGKKTISSFNFTITIDDSAPTATLVGAENGGVTAREVSLTNLSSGDVVKIYRNNQLISTTTVGISNNVSTITTSGEYRITITNVQGVTVEYTFVKRPIASVSASVFIAITCTLAFVGMGIGLIYHTKLKSDD